MYQGSSLFISNGIITFQCIDVFSTDIEFFVYNVLSSESFIKTLCTFLCLVKIVKCAKKRELKVAAFINKLNFNYGKSKSLIWNLQSL